MTIRIGASEIMTRDARHSAWELCSDVVLQFWGETGKYFTPESMSKADQIQELTKDAKAAVGEALGNLELLM